MSIVVPCYNESEVLSETSARLCSLLERLVRAGNISGDSALFFVDDGSRDGTWELIEKIAKSDGRVNGIKLSRNRGHQNALLAGLLTAPGDIIVSMDSDLQDDVEAVAGMIAEYSKGADIVYGVREDRNTDSWFKRFTAEMFYKLFYVLGVDFVDNHADYRLMSRRAVDALRQFGEVNIFLRAIVPLIGYKSTVVYYKRQPRYAGKSKYPLGKMISFAWQGITSFSVAPLRFVTYIGAAVFSISLLMSGYVLAVRLLTDRTVPGWTSTVLPIYLLGGIQVFCIGIVGEYLGKMYQEVKARPRFIVEKLSGKGFSN